MAKQECQRITNELRVRPYYLNCADAVPMQRPSLCWTSEDLRGVLEGLSFSEEEYWTAIPAPAPYPSQHDWVAEGSWWPGGDQGYTLPTALKSIERKKPLPSPAGLHRCDGEVTAIGFLLIITYHGFYSGLKTDGGWHEALRKNCC